MTRTLRLVLGFALVVSLATAAQADKTVSITYRKVVLSDVVRLTIERQGADLVSVATIKVRDADDKTASTITVTTLLSAGQKTAIEGYIITHVLAAANTQEGL